MTRIAIAILLAFIVDIGYSRSQSPELTSGPLHSPPLSIFVADVPGFLERLATITGASSADTSATDFKRQCGTILGDSTLTSMSAHTNAVCYFGFNGDAAMFLPVSKATINDHVQRITKAGGFATSTSHMLLLTRSKHQLTTMASLSGRAQQDLAASDTEPAIRLFINVQQFLNYYESNLESWMTLLPPLAVARQYNLSASDDAQRVRRALEQMAEVWFRTYWALLRRTESIELILTMPETGVRVDCQFHPVHKIHSTSGTKAAERLLSLLPAAGAIRSELSYEPSEHRRVFLNVAEELAAQMQSPKSKSDAWKALIDNFFQSVDGSLALSQMQKGKPGFNATYAIGLRDPEACLAMLKQFPDSLKDAGITDLYSTAGVSLTLKFQAGQRTYHSISIHRMVYRMDISSIEQLPMGAMELTDLSADLAIVDNVLLLSMGSASMEDVIDRATDVSAPSNIQLRSKAMLQPDGRLYMDYNLVQAFSALAGILPPNASNIFKRNPLPMNIESPILIAGYSLNDELRVTFLIPARLLQAISTAYMKSHPMPGVGK